eukprot:1136670-Pelagomonas_calceolata.AAC.6
MVMCAICCCSVIPTPLLFACALAPLLGHLSKCASAWWRCESSAAARGGVDVLRGFSAYHRGLLRGAAHPAAAHRVIFHGPPVQGAP